MNLARHASPVNLKSRRKFRILDMLICLALSAVLVVPIAPIFLHTGKNLGEMIMLSPDDFGNAHMVWDELARRSWSSKQYFYPHFYYNVVKWPLLLVTPFVPVSEAFVIAALRLASLLPSVLLLCVMYLWVGRRFTRPAGVIAAMTIGLSPAFVEFCYTIHPDGLQMLLIGLAVILSLRFALRQGGALSLLGAFACAGMAFSTKYHGAAVAVAPVFACFHRVWTGDLPTTQCCLPWRVIRAFLAVLGLVSLVGGIFFNAGAVSTYIIESGKLLPPAALHLLVQMRILAGIFGVACLALAAFWALPSLVRLREGKWAGVFRWTVTGGVVALIAAFVVSPFSFIRLGFLKGLGGLTVALRTLDITGGYGAAGPLGAGVPSAGFGPVRIFLEQTPAASLLLAALAFGYLLFDRRRRSRDELALILTASLVTAVFLGSLLLSSLSGGKQLLPHYMLPTLVASALLAAAGFQALTESAQRWRRIRFLPYLVAACVAVSFLSEYGNLQKTVRARMAVTPDWR